MTLAHYTARAKALSIAELVHALRDLKETLRIHRDRPLSDPYVAKLYAEFDAYSVEIHRREQRTAFCG